MEGFVYTTQITRLEAIFGTTAKPRRSCCACPVIRTENNMTDVHTETPFGITNHSATEYAFEYTNQTATSAGTIWRDELYLVVESYKIINIHVDRRTRRVGVSSKLN